MWFHEVTKKRKTNFSNRYVPIILNTINFENQIKKYFFSEFVKPRNKCGKIYRD